MVQTMASMLAIQVEARPSPHVIARRFLRVSETAALETFEDLWRHLMIRNVLDEETAGNTARAVHVNISDFGGTVMLNFPSTIQRARRRTIRGKVQPSRNIRADMLVLLLKMLITRK